VIVQWRNRLHGVLRSDLGGYLAGPAHAPAGTKRISRLIHATSWRASLIAAWLWQRALARVAACASRDEAPLVIWDARVWEKPESLQREGPGSVRSRTAHRLTRPRPGFFSSPPHGRPIGVAGLP
jgi:hypothetical protein